MLSSNKGVIGPNGGVMYAPSDFTKQIENQRKTVFNQEKGIDRIDEPHDS